MTKKKGDMKNKMKKLFTIFLCLLLVWIPVSAENLETNILPLLSEMKILEGDPDGNLRLDDYVSRAEFTKVAIAASKYKNSVALNLKVSPFKDVTHHHWAAPYIKLAADNKLVNGYPDSSFRPTNTVLYEEALNVFLKLLGYDESDFGTSWPYGQIGLATNIGLCDDMDKSMGDFMTRRDVAYLTYNLLNLTPKAGNAHYIESLNYKIQEDVILLGTPMTDSSVGSGRVNTTAGNYKTTLSLDASVGKKGDLILKNSDEVVSFVPAKQYIEEYLIYQILDDDIVVSQNGSLTSLSIDKSLTVYNKSQATTLQNSLSGISMGDTLTLYKTDNMVLDYGVISTELLQGPITATSDSVVATNEETTYIRNGVQSSGYELNDILYYSPKLNTVWAYSKRISGIYESASPNRDNPTSVVISGTTYQLEGTEAFYKLSSKGSVRFGDTVTVLLGKDGKIADVLSGISETVVGYLIETGKKNFANSDGSEYSSYYVKVVRADGEELEYSTASDYSSIENKIVKITFPDGKAKVTSLGSDSNLQGTFDYDNYQIGSKDISPEISILDVSTIDSLENGSSIRVYPQRLDGITLSKNHVLYYEKNNDGEIDVLFLYDVTGDAHQYGIVTNASEYNERSNNRSYTYDINGVSQTVNASIFTAVSSGAPCKFVFSDNAIDAIVPLSKLKDAVNQVSDFTLVCDGKTYQMSDSVVIYEKTSSYQYMKVAKDEFLENQSDYSITAYYDKAEASGGRIRVLVAIKKPGK